VAGTSGIQLVTWGLTALGTAVSLVWNWYNAHNSGKIARTLREEQYKSGQWTRIRGKIDGSMDALSDAVDALLAQVKIDSTNTAASGFIQQAVSQAHDRLAQELGDASASIHCAGNDWEVTAYGKNHAGETSWDLVVRALGDFDAATTSADRIAALNTARVFVSEIKGAVNERLRIQDNVLDPARI
jgi:hypothetical protein